MSGKKSLPFIARQECDKVAFQNGFRRSLGEADGWRRYGSTTAQGSIWLRSSGDDDWLLSVDHVGVLEEIGLPTFDTDGPGVASFRFDTLAKLYALMPRFYELSVSLPDAPFHEFLHRTKGMPKSTEIERLVIQRVGQSIFRDGLISYWQGQCPLTGITDLGLLRASHIKPWKDCESDEQRLDVHNGLLLSALWDAAFDGGSVTFSEGGDPIFSDQLSDTAVGALRGSMIRSSIQLTKAHLVQLSWHGEFVFKN